MELNLKPSYYLGYNCAKEHPTWNRSMAKGHAMQILCGEEFIDAFLKGFDAQSADTPPVTLKDAIEAMQGLLSWFDLDRANAKGIDRPISASEMLKGGCPNELKVDIFKCLGVIARSTLIKDT